MIFPTTSFPQRAASKVDLFYIYTCGYGLDGTLNIMYLMVAAGLSASTFIHPPFLASSLYICLCPRCDSQNCVGIGYIYQHIHLEGDLLPHESPKLGLLSEGHRTCSGLDHLSWHTGSFRSIPSHKGHGRKNNPLVSGFRILCRSNYLWLTH